MFDAERIRANANWAFLRVLPRKDKTASGLLHLPESNEEKVGYCLAEILSLGPGKWNPRTGKRQRDQSIEVGQTVFVRRYLTEVNPATRIGNKEFCFVDQGDLFAEVDPDADITTGRL